MAKQSIYGVHAVQAVLQNPQRVVDEIFIHSARADSRIQELIQLATDRQIPIVQLTLPAMNQRFNDAVHQGIAATVTALPEYSERDLPKLLEPLNAECLILILDGITDPHNLGACLRSADAAGVNFVVMPKDNSANITPVVQKVACGAAELMPIVRVTNLVRAMEIIKQHGVWIYGAAGEADSSIYHLNAVGPLAIVLGAEGRGMRRLTREKCDGLFSLPMLGSVSSLNVSVACGISLYEVVRQRIKV